MDVILFTMYIAALNFSVSQHNCHRKSRVQYWLKSLELYLYHYSTKSNLSGSHGQQTLPALLSIVRNLWEQNPFGLNSSIFHDNNPNDLHIMRFICIGSLPFWYWKNCIPLMQSVKADLVWDLSPWEWERSIHGSIWVSYILFGSHSPPRRLFHPESKSKALRWEIHLILDFIGITISTPKTFF